MSLPPLEDRLQAVRLWGESATRAARQARERAVALEYMTRDYQNLDSVAGPAGVLMAHAQRAQQALADAETVAEQIVELRLAEEQERDQ